MLLISRTATSPTCLSDKSTLMRTHLALPSIQNFSTGDVDEYMMILRQYYAPAIAKPAGSTPFDLKSKAVFTGGLCFSRTTWSSETEIEFETVFDGYALSMPMTGGMLACQSGGKSIVAGQGRGLMLDSRSTIKATFGENTNLDRISVSMEEMHGRLAALIDKPVLRRIQFSPHVDLENSLSTLAVSLLNFIHTGLEGPAPLLAYPAALTSLREAVLNLMLEGIPHNYSERLTKDAKLPSPGSVKRAMEYMAENASQPLRLVDIANAAGVSIRSLQYGFAQFRGTTPMAYLRLIRLNGVRAELSLGRAGTKVANVAHSWGFFHLSSFAYFYVRQFGETPSMTLKKASRG